MDKLKEWRKALGMTQEQAARMFGVKRLTILRYDKSIPLHMRRIMDLACGAIEAEMVEDSYDNPRTSTAELRQAYID